MVEWHSDTHGGGAWFNSKDHTTIQTPTFTEKQNIDSCIRSLNWKANLCHATGNLYTSGVSLEFFYLVFFFHWCFVLQKDSFPKETFSCSKTWLESLTIQSLHNRNGAKQTGAQSNLANQSGNSPTHPFIGGCTALAASSQYHLYCEYSTQSAGARPELSHH